MHTDVATKKPAKKKEQTPTGLVVVNLRMPADLLEAIDARVEALNAQGGWPKSTRTDWIREVLSRAVKQP